MASSYSGYKVAIASTSNASPIVVTTATPHGRNTGDTVLISNTGGSTASGPCDGEWQITKIDATSFSLVSSAAPGATSSALGFVYYSALTTTIPGDGDSRDAASVNISFEANADRNLANRAGRLIMVQKTFTANGTITFPANVIGQVIAEGFGGGGGGGGGSGNSGAANTYNVSGGGGGGARLRRKIFIPFFGHLYTVTIGAGGAAGAAGANAASGGVGGDGGDTTVVDTTAVSTIATFRGASGGASGPVGTAVQGRRAPGGRSVKAPSTNSWKNTVITSPGNPVAIGDSYGGDGLDVVEAVVAGGIKNIGWDSPDGDGTAVGGASGTNGTGGSPTFGGGPGGGGGAGPLGAGGAGGAGGTGSSTNTAGGAGTAAAANTGAGGGGGGAAGEGPVAQTGGAGGAGGSGLVTFYYYMPTGA